MEAILDDLKYTSIESIERKPNANAVTESPTENSLERNDKKLAETNKKQN